MGGNPDMGWLSRHKKAVLALTLAAVLGAWWRYDHRFTPERWQEAGAAHRGKLLQSLLRQYDLVGMSREEVEVLLGPDQEGEQWAEWLNASHDPFRDPTREGTFLCPKLVYPAYGQGWPKYLELTLVDGQVAHVRIALG